MIVGGKRVKGVNPEGEKMKCGKHIDSLRCQPTRRNLHGEGKESRECKEDVKGGGERIEGTELNRNRGQLGGGGKSQGGRYKKLELETWRALTLKKKL